MEGEIGECRKRKDSGDFTDWNLAKIQAMAAVGEEEEEEAAEEIEEEAVAEAMKYLEREISLPSDYYQSPAFVTINGNEESCGPSFSDFASTVMASVDTGGAAGVSYFLGDQSISEFPTEWLKEITPAIAAVGEEESDDEWLARVIGGAVLEMGEIFL